jgi:hypothetical protein
MQELDVTKKMVAVYDFGGYYTVNHIATLETYDGIMHVFSINEPGIKSVAITDKYGATIFGEPNEIMSAEPEVIAFDWNKPIRCVNRDYKVIKVDLIAHKVLIDDPSGERAWHSYNIEGDSLYSSFELENYEPEEKYKITHYPGCVIDKTEEFWEVESLQTGVLEIIAYSEENAQLFKEIKEQQANEVPA